jgi:hypothetical protein
VNLLRGVDPGRILIGALGLVVVAALSVAAGYVSRNEEPAKLRVAPAAPGVESVRGVVQSVTPDSITVLTDTGPVVLKVTSSTPRDAIQTAGPEALRPGDWVNAGGVPHAQTIFALTALVIIPAENLEGR